LTLLGIASPVLGVEGNEFEKLVSETLSLMDVLQKSGLDASIIRGVLNDAVKAVDSSPQALTPVSVIKDINRIVRKTVNALQVDYERTSKAFEIISKTYAYAYKTLGDAVSASILDAARQLAESALDSIKEDSSLKLLGNSEILLEGLNRVTAGGKLNLRVSRSETGESETTVATIPTSRDVVRVYLSEEKTKTDDNVVTTRKAFINLGNTIIIQKETISSVQPSATLVKEVHLGVNTALGAVVELREERANRFTLDKIEYDVVVKEYSLDQNSLRLLLSSNASHAGRVIILDVDRGIVRKYLQRDVAVKVDGKPAKLVDSVEDMLSGRLDSPSYFLAITAQGLQIVLYIPHWSDKLVVIGSSTALTFQISIPSTLGPETQLWATTFAALILASSVFVMRLRGRT